MPMSLEQELLRHGAALRRLATALVGEADAEDVVQDAAVQALTSPPRRPGPLGGWLAGVVRHLAARHHRSWRRRQRHERDAAREEALPADRSFEHQEMLRALTDAVLALPQPYRDTVVQRFLRGLPPRAIAVAMRVPVNTVKSRLKRALAMLRDQMTAKDGGDWRLRLAALFGLDGPAGTAAPVGAGVLMMTTIAKVAAGAVVALGLCTWLILREVPHTSPAETATGPLRRPELVTAPAIELDRAVRPSSVPQRIHVSTDTMAVLRGRIVRAEDHAPLAGSGVRLRGERHGDAWLEQHLPLEEYRSSRRATSAMPRQ